MNALFYSTSVASCRLVKRICIRERVLFTEHTRQQRPMLLAVTHISHLEPVFVSMHLGEPVRWMTRLEFFNTWWGKLLLHRCGAFCVDRFGFSLPAVRTAIRLLDAGQSVGVFPEGGVAVGANSVLRGGPIRLGVCTIAIRSGVPILPVVVLGTDDLNRIVPWIPAKRGSVWIAYGEPVVPPPRPARADNRRARAQLGEQLQAEFKRVYQELLAAEGIDDGDVP